MTELRGRIIKRGRGAGRVLFSRVPLSFFGGVDLDRGVVSEPGHPLNGRSIAGHVLVFPHGKGSTVGSYALLRLARRAIGPAAIVNRSCETIVAVGAIIAGIPCVDLIDIDRLAHVDNAVVDDGVVSWQDV